MVHTAYKGDCPPTCGKLYVRMRSDLSPLPIWLFRWADIWDTCRCLHTSMSTGPWQAHSTFHLPAEPQRINRRSQAVQVSCPSTACVGTTQALPHISALHSRQIMLLSKNLRRPRTSPTFRGGRHHF